MEYRLLGAQGRRFPLVIVFPDHLVKVRVEQDRPSLLHLVVSAAEALQLCLAMVLLEAVDVLQDLAQFLLRVRVQLDHAELLGKLRLQTILPDVLPAALGPSARPGAAVVDVRRGSAGAWVVLGVFFPGHCRAALAADEEAAVRERFQLRPRVPAAVQDVLALVEGGPVYHRFVGPGEELSHERHRAVVKRIGEAIVEAALTHHLSTGEPRVPACPEAEVVEPLRDLLQGVLPTCQELPALLEEREPLCIGDEHRGLLLTDKLVAEGRQEAPLVQDPHLVVDALLHFLAQVLDFMPGDRCLNP